MASSTKPATEEAKEMLREIRNTAITIIAAAAVSVAALAASASSASAALLVRSPATIRTAAVIQPPKTVAMEAGSAGIPGYDDERCQELLGEAGYYENKFGEDAKTAGETSMGTPEHQQAVDAAHYDTEVAYQDKQELSDNCLVVD
jgi:hypothetical protein